jgi:hypothetical protein
MEWRSRLVAWSCRAPVMASAAGIVVLSLGPAPALAASASGASSAGSSGGGVDINGQFGLAPEGGQEGEIPQAADRVPKPAWAPVAPVGGLRCSCRSRSWWRCR